MHTNTNSPNFAAQVAIAIGLDPDTDEAAILAHVVDLARRGDDEGEGPGGDKALLEAGVHPRIHPTDDGRALVVTLMYPIKSGSEVIRELTIRRANVRDLKNAETLALRSAPIGKGKERIDPGPMARLVATLSTLTGRAQGEIEELDDDDMGAIGAAMGFLSRRRPTGPK